MRYSNSRHALTPRRASRIGGFSLIEVLVALFLLAATAMVFGVVYPSGARARTKAQYYSQALATAQRKIEDCRYTGYADLSIEGPTDTSITALPNGNLRYTVTQHAADIKRVDVVVTWQGYGGVGGTVRVSSLISDHS